MNSKLEQDDGEKPMGRIRARQSDIVRSGKYIAREMDMHARRENPLYSIAVVILRYDLLRCVPTMPLCYALRISGRNIAGGGRFGVTKERILNSEKPTGDICIV